ncbi:MAG: hypothetical protein U0236_17940 [Nitrospira sp.]
MKMTIRLSVLLALVLWFSTVHAEMRVDCIQGCEKPGTNQSVNLLLRTSESVPVVIRWITNDNPQSDSKLLTLYAGNPVMQDSILKRGPLTFQATTQGEWEAKQEFSGSELGRGTFLAVVTERPKDADPEDLGESEEILDWRAFRLLTTAEQQRKEQGVSPGGAGSLTIAPALLQASTGHGVLPPARGGDKRAWWSLADQEGNTADLDLDGEQTGIPGLTIQVSTPWHTRGTDDWKEAIQRNLTGVTGHHVRFGNLEWREQSDRTVTLGGKRALEIRHYYAVVTLFTNASVKTFDDKEAGASHWFTSPTYFSHETSARLTHTDDPRFWASYSRHEYSADQRLLRILARQVRRFGRVPGVRSIQVDDGDGGSTTYTAGFYATVRPWESATGGGPKSVQAGFVGLDVVAARAGIGGLVTEGSAGTSTLRGVWCQLIRCGESGHGLDLDEPPSGYQVTQPVASLATFSGELPMIQERLDEHAELAEKGLLPEGTDTATDTLKASEALAALPTRVRFGISANLRSGALLQKEGLLGQLKNVVPINTYAQFVVKLTVAMVPNAQMVTTGEAVLPLPVELTTRINVPPPTGFWAWLTEHPLVWIAALVGGVGLVLAFVPGGMTLLRSIMGVITQALQLVVDAISLLLKKLAELVHRKSGG